jgi:hypothetical protein
MTNPLSVAALPLYVSLAARLTTEQASPGPVPGLTPLIGAADVEADALASGAPADLTFNTSRDSAGVPVGEADLEADKRRSGA